MRTLGFLAVLGLITLLVFGKVVTFEQINWDDNSLIFENRTYRPVTSESLRTIWTTPIDGMYNPLTRSYWALEAWLCARTDADGKVVLDPHFFHAGNLLLHVANVLLVFVILRQLIGASWGAFGGALLFAVHPIQVEPVAWISEGKGTLSGLFCLFAIWQYLCFREVAADRPNRSNVHYGLAVVAFVLANLAKSASVTLPLVLVIVDRFWLRRGWKDIAISLGPWFVLSAVGVVAQKLLQPDEALKVQVAVWWRPLVVLDGWGFYLQKLVVPYPLFPFYDHSAKVVTSEWSSWLYAAIFVGFVLVLSRSRQKRIWLIGVGIAVAFALPYSGFVLHAIQRVSTVQDRYMYLAMLGPAFCLAWALTQDWGRRRLCIIVTAMVMVVLAGMSFIQLDIWKNDQVFFPYAVAQNPRSAEALRWVAFLDEVGGNYQRAEATLRQAIEYEPKYADLYYNLGICLQFQKRYDEAIDAYQTALELQPGMLVAHQNLALAYIDSSRAPEAGKHLQFLLDAGFQEFWVKEKLGTILLEKGDYAGAEKLYREALKTHPRWPEGYANFGIALAESGKLDDAALAFRAAIELDPRNESLKQNLQRLEALRQRK